MKQKTGKKLLGVLLMLAIVIGLMQGMTLTAYADSAHTHDGITFVEWTDALAQAQNGSSSTSRNSLPSKPGNYYLTKDVTLMSGERWDVPAGETHLCLNNHGIIQKVGFNRNFLIRIKRYVILNLYDSDTPKTTYTYSTAFSGITTVGGQGKSFTGGYITGGHGNNAGGVYIDGGTFNMYGGTIIGNRTGANGGGVCIAAGTFNMYDGAIIGNYGCDNNPRAPGGGGVYNNGTFNMFGGEISANTCTHDGGGVFNNTRGIFTMAGSAKITNNRSGRDGGGYGGGVFNKGTFNMEGGEISGNRTSYYCGGVQNEGTFKLYSNAIIRGNFGGTSADIEGTVTVVSESNANEPDDETAAWTVTVKTLTYNGNAQKLLTAAAGNGNKMYYAVTRGNTAPPDESHYTTSIPTATEAGTYYVWLKVVGDANHNDIVPQCIPVTILQNEPESEKKSEKQTESQPEKQTESEKQSESQTEKHDTTPFGGGGGSLPQTTAPTPSETVEQPTTTEPTITQDAFTGISETIALSTDGMASVTSVSGTTGKTLRLTGTVNQGGTNYPVSSFATESFRDVDVKSIFIDLKTSGNIQTVTFQLRTFKGSEAKKLTLSLSSSSQVEFTSGAMSGSKIKKVVVSGLKKKEFKRVEKKLRKTGYKGKIVKK